MTLFLLLWGCAPSTPGDPGPGDNPDTQPGTQPIEMGVEIIAPEALPVRVDSAIASCDGAVATLSVDTLGHADAVELDLLQGNDVRTVELTMSERPEGAVWVQFTGEAPCDALTNATWILRAFRDGDAADCSVHGSDANSVLMGMHDPLLGAAGRPNATGCHPLAEE